MNILGLQKLTLLDYPGHMAAIVFLGGCNFRCPFCQNSSLVLSPGHLPIISQEEFRQFLHKRSGLLEGICVTGGEPTLHPDLPEFFSEIKAAGYLTKLDTNGTNPHMLQKLIQEGLVDYVAMDIKSGRNHYARVCGISRNPTGMFPENTSELLQKIDTSVSILMHSPIEYEFRTTVVEGLHCEKDFLDIRQWIAGCSHYYLQYFRDCPEVLTKEHDFSAFTSQEMQHFLSIVQETIPQAEIRGE